MIKARRKDMSPLRRQCWWKIVKKIILYIVMSVISFIIAGPLIWMVLSSFKSAEEIWRLPPTLFPIKPTIDGFCQLFDILPYGRIFFNSVFVTISTTFLVMFISSIAGYVFAKFDFLGKNIIFIIVLSTLMLPFEAIVVPLYMLMKLFHWLDTYYGLIFPPMTLAFGIFLMRQFMHEIPRDYVDAARIDGLSEVGIYLRIILPLVKTPLSALGMFTFLMSWDSFMWPLIVVNSPSLQTLPLGIATLTTTFYARMELIMPAASLATVPMLIVFTIFQRHLVRGFALAGIKT